MNMRAVRILIVLSLMLGLFQILDWHLVSRADALVEPVILDYRRHLSEARPLPWTRQIDGVEADLCNTLTGGIWGRFLLPRSARYRLPESLVVEVKSGFCRRHHKSTLVFTATP